MGVDQQVLGQAINRMRTRAERLRPSYGFVGMLAALVQAQPAAAICITPPTVELKKLATLSGADPHAALIAVAKELERAKKVGSPASTIAWLHVIESDAYWQLSDTPRGGAAALAGLKSGVDKRDPVYTQLSIQYVFRDFRTETFHAAIPDLIAARAGRPKDSEEDICLQATIGDTQRLSGDATSAAANLAAAYRTAQQPDRERQRIYAGYALALFMRSAGDYTSALALLAERAAWDAKMGHTFKLAEDNFMVGRLMRLGGKNEEALPKIREAQRLAVRNGDEIGIVFYQLEECAILTALRKLPQATKVCEPAMQAFAKADTDMIAEVQIHLADIALQRHQPARAITLLNQSLASPGAKSSSYGAVNAYRLRSEAYAALKNSSAAYRDLREYVRLFTARTESERARQVLGRQAEVDAERQFTQNRILEQKLLTTEASSHEQSVKTTIVISAGTVIIALLIALAYMFSRNRKTLEKSANTDPLTGLLNRRSIVETSKAKIEAATRSGKPLSVAILDLDHFKQVNDTYGHASGDEVLKLFAATLQAGIRRGDIVARWGGEEFLLVMPATTPDVAVTILDRIRQSAAEIGLTFSNDYVVAFSAGISQFGDQAQLFDDIINQADAALYTAKDNGRSRSECWSEGMGVVPPRKTSARETRSPGA